MSVWLHMVPRFTQRRWRVRWMWRRALFVALCAASFATQPPTVPVVLVLVVVVLLMGTTPLHLMAMLLVVMGARRIMLPSLLLFERSRHSAASWCG